MSRSANSMQNLFSSIVGEFLSILLKFVTRSVFISYLGTQFLGINGLFTNILSILALTELGLGTAITYNLYKPILENNTQKINSLMRFYKQIYRYIALIIAIIGVGFIPFLPYIIKDDLSFINVNLIFLIYLMQSVSTYAFFAYKGALIKANQKEYIINYVGYYFSIITSVVQIISLVYFKNFTFYIFIVVLSNILKNLVVAHKANKLYPYLKENSGEKLDETELNAILKNAYAIVLYKFNAIVLNATDNIIISTFIGLELVGLYSNYLLIVVTIKTFLGKFYQSINASLGSLHSENRSDYSYRIFKTLNFFTVTIYGIAAIGVYVTSDFFLTAWIGSQFILPPMFVFLLSVDLYMHGLNRLFITYRNSLGLFQHAKYRPLIGSILNLIISLSLVKPLGIVGVLTGTVVSNLLTVMWYDPIIILKHGFNVNYKSFFVENIKYSLLFMSVGLSLKFTTSMISLNPLIMFLMFGTISILMTLVIIYFMSRNKQEYLDIERFIKRFLSRKSKEAK